MAGRLFTTKALSRRASKRKCRGINRKKLQILRASPCLSGGYLPERIALTKPPESGYNLMKNTRARPITESHNAFSVKSVEIQATCRRCRSSV